MSVVIADGFVDTNGFDGFNGAYKDNTVYLNLSKTGDGINYVAGHELLHHISANNADGYKTLEKVVVKALESNKNYNFDEEIQKMINLHWELGNTNFTKADAVEEIVAESCFDVLSNEKNINKIVEKDKTLAETIKDWLTNFIAKLKEVASQVGKNRAEYRALHDDIEALDKINDTFYSALLGTKKADTNSDGEVRYMLVGTNKEGIAEYKSDFSENLLIDEKLKIFKERIATIFNLGAVSLKTDTKKIVVRGDSFTVQKNVFGDRGNNKEYEAKINALYDYADILGRSSFVSKNVENSYQSDAKAKNNAHRNVKYWYKFENNIVLDGMPYKVVFNVRDKGKEQYEYLIEFHEKSKKTLNYRDTANKNSFARLGSKSSNTNISQDNNGVNSYDMQKEKNNAKFMLPSRDSNESDIQLYRNQQYVQEIKALNKQIEVLKQQFKITKGYKLSEKSITGFTERMLNKYKSDYDFETMKTEITTLFEYEVFREIEHSVKTANKAFKDEKASTIEDLGA